MEIVIGGPGLLPLMLMGFQPYSKLPRAPRIVTPLIEMFRKTGVRTETGSCGGGLSPCMV